MLAEDAVTPRVNALAKLMGDTVEAFFERPNGEVVIVFTNKGKHTFKPEPTIEPEVPTFEPIIYTNEDAQEVVQTLTPTHKPSPKKKEK